ncbi:hypothetical protein B0H11DRAFT_2262225 [Mycena galericulata]|nr:hypothetical protein B0H11DRAFT_2262225 [Mycena galericulata]
MPSKKPRRRVPKEQRLNLRLWAEGARESVLKPHIEPYADALDRGWRAERDYLKLICNEFHARISWRLKDHEEPELPLPEFDPAKALTTEELDDEEEILQREHKAKLDKRIRRWFKYRVRRLRKQLGTRRDPRKDPWAVLLSQLSGIRVPSKARQAYQQFMTEAYITKIAPEVERLWAKHVAKGSNIQTKKEPTAPFRAEVARGLFAKLPESERLRYAKEAKEEAAAKRKAFKDALKNAPSKSPEDRQKCIDNLGTFVGPILEGIHERTGLHSVLLMGGPIPKYGGDLRTIYVAYGRNKTAAPAHFPQWGRDRFDGVLELMKEYLRTAFTPQDMEEMCLPESSELDGAKYTMPDDSDSDSDSESDSDSQSDSDSDSDSSTSDSNAESDDSDRPKSKAAKKKAKAAKAKAAKAKAAEKKGKEKAREKEKENMVATGNGVSVGEESSAARPKKGMPKKKGAEAQKSAGGKRKRPAPAPAPAPAPVPATKKARTEESRAGAGGEEHGMDVDIRHAANPTGITPPTPAATQALPASTATALQGGASATTPAQQTDPTPATPPPPTPPPAPQPSIAVEVPSDAPDWLVESIAWLKQEDLGCHYASLLVALINLEAKYGYEKNNRGMLPAAKRPQQVYAWIKGGRGKKMKFPPSIGNLAHYQRDWWVWWDSLQPEWRERDDDGRWSINGNWGPSDAWDPLEAPGPNGCLSVVASLYFWGIALAGRPETRAGWEAAVQDVAWMLEGLAASIA